MRVTSKLGYGEAGQIRVFYLVEGSEPPPPTAVRTAHPRNDPIPLMSETASPRNGRLVDPRNAAIGGDNVRIDRWAQRQLIKCSLSQAPHYFDVRE
jgi:hypothetical protein